MTKTIEEKYNRLYREVAKHYYLDHMIVTDSPNTQLHFIKIMNFGYNELGNIGDQTNSVLSHLEEFFPYLAPFYKYFHRGHFCQPGLPDSNIQILKEINKVITKIRKEK